MWQSIDHKVIFTEISSKIKTGIFDENDLHLLQLCIKKETSKLSLKTEVEKCWFKKLCCEILLVWRPSINEIDFPNRTGIEKIMIDILKMAIVVDTVFDDVLIQLTNLMSSLHKSFGMELEKCSEEKLIMKMKDTVQTLLILCNSTKLYNANSHCGKTLTLLKDILLMEWVSEKDFVILNQIFSLFLDLKREQDRQVSFITNIEIIRDSFSKMCFLSYL